MGEKKESLFGSSKVLSEESLTKIHEATLKVLNQVGVVFRDPSAREVLRKSGASITGELVRFPAELVNEMIEQAPLNVVLGARDPQKTITLGGNRMLTTNGFGALLVLDMKTRKYRDASSEDLRNLTIIGDALPNVDYCQFPVTPQDIPSDLLDVAQAFIALSNTGKHVHLSTYNDKYLEEVIAVGEAVSDRSSTQGYPAYSLGCCPVSPLRYPLDTTTRLIESAKRNIPFLIVSGAITGVTAPVTLAGTLVVQNAELLAGFALAQCVSSGAPIVYGSFSSSMDPNTGQQLWGTPEMALMNAATAQLCRQYRIPFGYGTGGVSDSFVSGFQTGFEKSFTTLLGALCGVEVVHDAVSGIVGSARAISYEQLILDSEMCDILRHCLRGIEVNKDTLAVDVIQQVGPGGNYLTSMHTAKNLRKAVYISKIWERGLPSTLDETALLERAAARVEEILTSHHPLAISSGCAKEMKAIWRKVGLEGMLADTLGPVVTT